MFAIAIDGELVASGLKASQVLETLRDSRQEEAKIEVASFDPGMRKWVPVCLGKFAQAA